MKRYKILQFNMQSIVSDRGINYEIGKEYYYDKFNENCDNIYYIGFHVTDIDGIIKWFNKRKYHRIFEVKVLGNSRRYDMYERRCEGIEIIREISYKELKELALKSERSLGYKLSNALFPHDPFINQKEVILKDIDMLNLTKWASFIKDYKDTFCMDTIVWSINNTLYNSYYKFIWNEIRDSMRNSIIPPMRNDEWNEEKTSIVSSIQYSIWAYIGSIFPYIEEWEGVLYNIKSKNYPFQALVDLWEHGLVPNYYNGSWRLCNVKNCEILFKG